MREQVLGDAVVSRMVRGDLGFAGGKNRWRRDGLSAGAGLAWDAGRVFLWLAFLAQLPLFGQAASPGGIGTNLELWLKADAGVFNDAGSTAAAAGDSVQEWHDQSGNNRDVEQTTSGDRPTLNAASTNDDFNFNPSLTFTSGSLTRSTLLGSSSDGAVFAVVRCTDLSGDNMIIEFAGNLPEINLDNARPGLRITQVGGTPSTATHSTPLATGVTYLTGTSWINGSNQDVFLRLNGDQDTVPNFDVNGNVGARIDIGANSGGSEVFMGEFAEILVYSDTITSTSSLGRIESYLALKYGITLDQSSARDYLDSAGSVIWDASVVGTGYDEDIAGIGQDDGSGLDQTQSKSVNSDAIVTIAENGGGMADGEFLIWSNDGASKSFGSTDVPSGVDERLTREWRIEETGEVGSIDVHFDVSGISLPPSVHTASDFFLLVDGDGTFASGASVQGASSFNNNVVIFTGIGQDVLDDGDFFTLGLALPAPGGVIGNLKVWLKADLGTSTTTDGADVATWSDLSGNSNDAETNPGLPSPPRFRNNSSDNLNFNPTLEFNGSSEHLTIPLDDLEGKSNYALFVAGVRDDGSGGLDFVLGSSLVLNQFHLGYHNASKMSFLARDTSGSFNEVSVALFNSPTISPFILRGINSEGIEERHGVTTVNDQNTNGAFPNGSVFYIGRGTFDTSIIANKHWYFPGRISEVIAYDTNVDGGDENRVVSYLAIKYGISLGQNVAAQDYVDSAGNVIWDASVVGGTYDNSITAIGQDDGSGLNQTQSQTSNQRAIITMAENGGGMDNGEFLFWSHDDGSRTLNTTDVPSGIDYRLPRQWVLEETGEVGAVDVSFDLSQLTFPEGQAFVGDLFLLTDADGTFASGSSVLAASSVSGDVVTFTGVSASTLEDGVFLTLGYVVPPAPGSLNENLVLWLKADAGVYSDAGATLAIAGQDVRQWQDQSGFENHFSESNLGGEPTLVDAGSNSAFNYNPSLRFNSDSLFRNNLLDASDDATIYAVVRSDNLSSNNTILVFGTNDPAFVLDSTLPDFRVLMDSSTPSEAGHSQTIATDVTYLAGAHIDNGSNRTIELRLNGDHTSVTGFDINGNIGTFPVIGSQSNFSEPLIGDLAELIVFDRDINAVAEIVRLESYLALKYGITLDAVDAGDYLDSAGNVIWDASVAGASFGADIAGIGQDDASLLDQTKSTSLNAGTVVTVAENGGGMGDGEFLLWGNNGGSKTLNTTDLPSGMDYRVPRTWLVEETGEVGAVDISFDLSELTFPDGTAFLGDLFLLTDADGTFASGSSTLAASSLSNNIVTFTGVTGSTIEDGVHFTLGYVEPEAPGGVNAGVSLWLKADAGVFSDAGTTMATGGQAVQEWHDQTGHGHDVAQSTAGLRPTLKDGTDNEDFNFNPSLSFSTGPLTRSSLLPSDSDGTVFAVVQSTDLSTDNTVIEFGSDRPEFKLDSALPGLQINHSGGSPSSHTHQSPSLSTATTYLTAARWTNGSNQNVATRINGDEESLANFDINGNVGADIAIGGNGSNGELLVGELAELIVYDSNISSASELKRIESYLALKYGISLDQTSARDYVDSNGNVIWDASVVGTTYDHDIAGIGQDDQSPLDQTRSKSVNSDAVVTIIENGGGIANGEFLFWSNNDASTTFDTTDLPTGIEYRLPREWLISETGEVGAVDLSFDLSGLTLPDGTPLLANIFLLTDANGTFASGSTSIAASSLNGSVVTFSGLGESVLEDGTFFTLGIVDPPGPGGLNDGIALWLKADSEAYNDAGSTLATVGQTIQEWHDQSGHSHDVSQTTVSSQPTLVDGSANEAFNFNPSLNFSTAMLSRASLLAGDDDATILAVLRSTNFSGDNMIIDFGENDPEFNIENSINSFRFVMDGSDPRTADYSQTMSINTTYLTGARWSNGTNLDLGMSLNGLEEVTAGFDFNGNVASSFSIGANASLSEDLVGDLAEMIVFNVDHSDTTKRGRVESYLALKYGITLDQSTPRDYLDSMGNVIWDASVVGTAFDEDIAGIGQDDESLLDQTKSKSVNADASVIVAENGGGMDDGEFLFWANNGGSTALDTADLPAGIDFRLPRTWLVEETGDVGVVDISFDLSVLNFPDGDPFLADLFLLTDADGTFATGSAMMAASSLSNNVVTFTGVSASTIADGVFFSLGYVEPVAPGGLNANMALWLKAGAGAFNDAGSTLATAGQTVQEWHDQSGHDHDVAQSTSGLRPTLNTGTGNEGFNFNPTLSFTSGSLTRSSLLSATSDGTVFAVVRSTDLALDNMIVEFEGNHPEFNLDNARPGLRITHLGGSPSFLTHQEPALSVNTTYLTGTRWTNGSNQDVFTRLNGIQESTTGFDVNGNVGARIDIGANSGGTEILLGEFAELIIYSSNVSSVSDLNQVESYLALKYGITLDQTAAQDYVDSAGIVIWDASVVGTTFDEDIAGIGQDDGSQLDQPQSKSVNSDAVVTIAENGGGIADGEFLFWSNNGASTGFDMTDLPAGVEYRLIREWVVEEVGEVGAVDVSVDLSGLNLPDGLPLLADVFLLTDADGTFASGSTVTAATSLSNGVVTFAGLNESVLEDGTFFTVGIVDPPAPGGLNNGIALWLKAGNEAYTDGGTTLASSGQTVQEWHDQSGYENDVAQTNAGVRPTWNNGSSNEAFNFNPTLTFTSGGLTRSSLLPADSDGTVYAVVRSTDLTLDNMILEFEGNRPEINLDNARPGFRITHLGSSPEFLTHQEPALSINTTYLTGTRWTNGSNKDVFTRLNGIEESKALFDVNGNVGARIDIGANSGDQEILLGELAELIVYSVNQSDTAGLARIESYLALKYGVTLDQSVAQDYVDSVGNVIWDASVVGTSFDEDIAGIGQDDNTELDQTKSKSVNSDAIATLSENGGGMDDGEFLIWANNGASTAFDRTDLPTGIDYRLPRTWLVEETGEVGALDVSLDISGLTFPDGDAFLADLFLLMDADGTFASGASTLAASSLSNGVVTFTGVSEDAIEDGVFFTLGYVEPVAPGGHNAELALWLKAGAEAYTDAGTTLATAGQTVQEWHDQSGHNHDVAQASSGLRPTLNTGNEGFNFNPTLSFTSGSLTRSSLLPADSDGTVFAVVRSTDLALDNMILEFEGNHPEFNLDNARPGLRITHLGGSPSFLTHQEPALSINTTYLTGTRWTNGSNQDVFTRLNGIEESTTGFDVNGNVGARIDIGANSDGTEILFGEFAELIVYASNVSDAAALNRIESYLALKYGITLDQTTATDYLDSAGNVIWDASVVGTSFDEDIAGIGQDDGSHLDQPQSKSVNADAMVTIAENGGGIADGEFLFWSNNGGSNAFSTTDVPAGISQRLGRVWSVEETGEVGGTDLSFDLTGISLPTGIALAGEFFLLTDSDTTFASGASALVASSFVSNVVTFTGLDASVLADGRFFTLGVFDLAGPGNAVSGIQLWLKADSGTSTTTDGANVVAWADVSGNSNHATEATNPPIFRNDATDNINFNPVVDFDGVNDQLITTLSDLVGASSFSFVAVTRRQDGNVNPILGHPSRGTVSGSDQFHFGFAADSGGAGSFVMNNGGTSEGAATAEHNSPLITPAILLATDSVVIHERDGMTESDSSVALGALNNLANHYLGTGDTDFFAGEIAEVMVYRSDLSAGDRAMVLSYLGIKYGISLGQNSVAQNYIDSAGTVIWDATMVAATHPNDITAIGQDDDSGLNQVQARGSGPNAIVTIAENGGGMVNGEFLFWSHDGAATTFSTSERPSGVTRRLSREWRVEETGEVGSIDLSFDLNGLTLPTTSVSRLELLLLTDADGAFGLGASTLVASSYSNDVVTFSGIDENLLDDGTFFTLGFVDLAAPAGLNADLAVWLRADEGAFSDAGSTAAGDTDAIQEWHDQSGFDQDTEQTTSDNRPTFIANAINHNPALDFDAVNDLLGFKTAFDVGSDFDFFAVIQPDSTSPVGVFDGGPGQSDVFRNHDGGEFEIEANDPQVSLGLPDTGVHLLHLDVDHPGNVSLDYFLDGAQVGSTVTGASATGVNWPAGAPANLGAISGGSGGYYDGRIAEVILFSQELSSASRAGIQSYLAIKYGLTLDQTVAQNYVDSEGATIWDAASVGATFNRDIAAIGQDNASDLNQTQSTSSNSGTIVTLSESGNGMGSGEFLFWSHDNGDKSFSTTDVPDGIQQRLTRRWKVAETGEVGAVTISFDLSGVSVPSTVTGANELFLLTDADGTFASGASSFAASSFSSGVVTFSGVGANVLEDGTIFSLGLADFEGPGGVTDGIKLWLRADAGTSTTVDGQTIGTWSDQSKNGNDATAANNLPRFRDNESDNFNFNPVIDFDGGNDRLVVTLDDMVGVSAYTYIAVTRRQDGNRNVIIGHPSRDFEFGSDRFALGYQGFTAGDDVGLFIAADGFFASIGTGNYYNDPEPTPSILFWNNLIVLEERDGGTTQKSTKFGALNNLADHYIGTGDNRYFKGEIAEIMAYDSDLGNSDRSTIHSYLAIKYGISLGHNLSVQDYVDSSGNVIWDASVVGSSYRKQITAIGQDDLGGLNQTKSRSSSQDPTITIEENGGGMDDGEFLFWSHDGGAKSFSTSDVPSTIDQRLTRRWRVEETGEVGSIDVSFDINGVTLPSGVGAAADFYLLTDDTDDTFASGVNTLVASSFSNGVVTFTGIGEDVLEDGEFFTLGVMVNGVPDAVNDSLKRVPGTGLVKIFIGDLLENDSDPDGDSFSFVAAQLPATSANGSTLSVLTGNRWILYSPAVAAPATDDTFTYQIEDSRGGTDTATVTIATEVLGSQTRNNVRAAVSGNDIAVEFRGVPGRKYKVQYATSLVEPITWQDASGTITAGIRGRLSYTDVDAAGQHGSKFFRTVEVDE